MKIQQGLQTRKMKNNIESTREQSNGEGTFLPVKITKPKEFILLGVLESFRTSLTIVKLFVTPRQWIHQWCYKALYLLIS